MLKFIFYGSYLSFPFLLLVILLLVLEFKKEKKRVFIIFLGITLLLLSLTFIYARFIERYIVCVNDTKIKLGFKSKFAVIGDIHLGVYKDESFLRRVVLKINNQKNLDFLLIAGDLTYYPKKDNLKKLFEPLKELKLKTYVVLGNHDSESPGPRLREELVKIFKESGVIFLHNKGVKIKDLNINILGLGDNWASEDQVSLINNYSTKDNLIVLTHNPDTTLKYQNKISDLTVSGHAHGGQVRIPILYKKAIPCKGNFDKGIHDTKTGKVFVTSGLGEVGLPIRFLIPPVIDIIETY